MSLKLPLLLGAAALFASTAFAEAMPRAKPEAVGLSSERLARVTQAFNSEVERGVIPGAVVLIARDGKIAYQKTFGFRDRAANAPMTQDAIFRIASLTKPVTVAAALMLMEEGKLQPYESASRHLPELKTLQVGVERPGSDGQMTLQLEPLRREITVQDLMRHTAGFTYGPFGDSLVQRAYRAADVMNDQQTNAEMMAKLAKLPLAYQPGSTFEYGMSQDVLGRMIELISGVDLNQFVAERIAKPLKLRDTAFLLNEAQAARLAQYQPLAPGAAPLVIGYNPAKPPKWFSGGHGLVSTAEDYARFAQMLLNGGELDGVRVLSRKSVEWMTRNHLPPGVAYGAFTTEIGITAPLPQFGQGYGLGVGVREEQGRSPVPGSAGDFYWGGATGPYFWVDPSEKLVAVLMMQEANMQRRTYYRSLLRTLVYQALQ